MSKRKLLLADDSITIQKVVNLTFADEGIEVTAVSDGDTAMEKFVENMPDLVMVDVNMPGLDGYRICEIIKQDEETAHIPVILLVGSFEPFDEEEARRVGADDYLTKPFQSIRQLVGKVTVLLDANTKTGERVETFSAAAGESPQIPSPDTYSFPARHHSIAAEPARFDDDGTDDETIQTNQIGSLPVDEAQKFSADFPSEDASQISINKPFENSVSYETEETDWAKTKPLNTEELNEINSIPAHLQETAETGENVYNFAAGKNSSDESANDETPTRMTQSYSAWELDEINLLELPYDENENFDYQDETIDETNAVEPEAAEEVMEEVSHTTQEAQPEELSQPEIPTGLSEMPEETGSAVETSVMESAQTTNFTPEVIDAIAAKVVERLSDKVIREIAWEVVPQMADLIIQKMAQDKMKG